MSTEEELYAQLARRNQAFAAAGGQPPPVVADPATGQISGGGLEAAAVKPGLLERLAAMLGQPGGSPQGVPAGMENASLRDVLGIPRGR